MPALSARVVDEFCKVCNWTYEVWLTHRDLFNENPRSKELQTSSGTEGPSQPRN